MNVNQIPTTVYTYQKNQRRWLGLLPNFISGEYGIYTYLFKRKPCYCVMNSLWAFVGISMKKSFPTRGVLLKKIFVHLTKNKKIWKKMRKSGRLEKPENP